jgi:hypothetical protein
VGGQAANPVESTPVTAEKNRTDNEFLSWFLQEHCF